MEKEPICAKCGAKACSSFSTYRLDVRDCGLEKWVVLVYCTNCGTVYGTVDF